MEVRLLCSTEKKKAKEKQTLTAAELNVHNFEEKEKLNLA